MSLLPDTNNVYSCLESSVDLVKVMGILQPMFPNGKVGVYVSSYDSARTLTIEDPRAEFESTKTESGDYLFNGAIAGTNDEVIEVARRMFGALNDVGIRYQFEVYGKSEEMLYEQMNMNSEQAVPSSDSSDER